MKKLIRNGNSVIAVLSNGTVLQNDSCTDELFNRLQTCATDEELLMELIPHMKEVMEQRKKVEDWLSKVDKSQYLTREGSSVYWLSVSELSLPQNFVAKILEAEESNNVAALESYKNFWTLLSLNPDERIRHNLFWYLDMWGMCISKTGLFVGYRNVDIARKQDKNFITQELCDKVSAAYEEVRKNRRATADYWIVKIDGNYELLSSTELIRLREAASDKDSTTEIEDTYNLKDIYAILTERDFEPDGINDNTLFTDHHTGTMRIKIGEMVTMPREECDCNSDVECSRGLHLGGTGWLEQNYFGEVGLACLCNPRDVVAIPRDPSYGKLRTCAYLPVARIDYDENDHVIPLDVEDGFESEWVKTVLYDGIMATEDSPQYHIDIPEIPELNKTLVTENILEIARKYMK